MIIRSGLIRKRDGADLALFTNHWLTTHGPLAAAVPGLRGYIQNHILGRLPATGSGLHRVDGISQLFFDDLETMRVAMATPEQQACVEDIQGFLSDVTIVVQQEGRRSGSPLSGTVSVKLLYLLAGRVATLEQVGHRLCRDAELAGEPMSMRLNPVIDRSFRVDARVQAGEQVVDGILELWLGQASVAEAAASVVRACAGQVSILSAFEVRESVILGRGDKFALALAARPGRPGLSRPLAASQLATVEHGSTEARSGLARTPARLVPQSRGSNVR